MTPTPPINQELLILGLQNACPIFQGAYLEPGFFPILKQEGWPRVTNWSANPHNTTGIRPYSHHPNISIPVQIGGNHWVAVSRCIVSCITAFYYADDLNNKTTERTIKETIILPRPAILLSSGLSVGNLSEHDI
jgi:hypothetical protein